MGLKSCFAKVEAEESRQTFKTGHSEDWMRWNGLRRCATSVSRASTSIPFEASPSASPFTSMDLGALRSNGERERRGRLTWSSTIEV